MRVGFVIPCRGDSAHALRLGKHLVSSGGHRNVDIIIVDNGENDDLEASAPEGVTVLEEPEPGVARAMNRGSEHLVASWRRSSMNLANCWIVSIDADCSVGPEFVRSWTSEVSAPGTDVRCGRIHFGGLEAEPDLPVEVHIAWEWLWNYSRWLERFVGVTNSATNHAVRASAAEAVNYYIQPTDISSSGKRFPVAGTDWDFGLRSRLVGLSVSRVRPVCRTSTRRIADDPIGFLTGRAYESSFERASGGRVAGWPPSEEWSDVLDFAVGRFTGHYLVKPALCGIEIDPSLRWFIGEKLWGDLVNKVQSAADPPDPTTAAWLPFRRDLIRSLFDPETFELSSTIGRRLLGAR
jgi:hypothetical protein